MYIGRYIVVAPTWAGYRVSSRSFPNRRIIDRDGSLAVVPTDDAPETDNPYVSYHCLRPLDGGAVIGNGSHVDPIAEKCDLGYPPRDALVHGLVTLDFEKDDYDTPRIAGIVDGETGVIGIVRRDALLVRHVDRPTLVATYEHDRPKAVDLVAEGPAGIARAMYDQDFDHPVCAAGVTVDEDAVASAVYNGPEG